MCFLTLLPNYFLPAILLELSYCRIDPLEPVPFVIVLRSPTNQIKTLQNIYDVIYSSPLYAQVLGDFV